MSSKRILPFLALAVAAGFVATLVHDSDLPRRIRAHHALEVVLVSGDAHPLRILFGGMPANPRWNAKAALEAAKSERRCRNAQNGGFIGMVLSLFERTVSAQQLCIQTSCSGSYRTAWDNGTCNSLGCNGYYKRTQPDYGLSRCSGDYQTGSSNCAGPDCSGECNVEAGCNSCSGCGKDSDCPSGQYCPAGACVDKQCQNDDNCGNPSLICCLPDANGNDPACGPRYTCQMKGCTNDDSCALWEYCNTTANQCMNSLCFQTAPCHHWWDCGDGQSCQNHCCSGACDPAQKPVCADGSDPTCQFQDITFKWVCPAGNGGGSGGGGTCYGECGGNCSGACGVCGFLGYGYGGECACLDDYCGDPCQGLGTCDFDSQCASQNCGWWGCCIWEPSEFGGQQGADPILIDLGGAGFPLTNAQGGVRFDFQGNGTPVQMAWTAKGADVGFLVLDRDGNGRIDNGAELFSNLSPQPGGREGRNGFLALAAFDQPANGGNRDGWITAKDAVFPKLRIWVDKNHNGKSNPSELLTLAQAGVRAISINSARSEWTDAYGNQFRYRGEIVWDKPVNGHATAAIYDAILQEQR